VLFRRCRFTHNTQDNEGDQVEQYNRQLEDHHATIMKGIKLIEGEMKPCTMEVLHPVVGHKKYEEPHKQYAIVDDGTPHKKTSHDVNAHRSLLNIQGQESSITVVDDNFSTSAITSV
jgi:hypothetical protein